MTTKPVTQGRWPFNAGFRTRALGQHGTVSSYRNGCPCLPCGLAGSEANAAYRAKKRSVARAQAVAS